MLLVQQQKLVDWTNIGRCTENGKLIKLKEQKMIYHLYLNPTIRAKNKESQNTLTFILYRFYLLLCK